MNRETEDFLRELLEEDRRLYRHTLAPWLGASATLVIAGLVLLVLAW